MTADWAAPEIPVPPSLPLPAGPDLSRLREAVASLDSCGRVGADRDPLFLCLSARVDLRAPSGGRRPPRRGPAPGADTPAPRAVGYLGLTADSERWLAAVAGTRFAGARRRRLAEALAAGDAGGLPDDPAEQVGAAAQALRRAVPAAQLTLAAMPLGLGEGSGSGLAWSCDPQTGEPGPVGLFAPGRTGSRLLEHGGQDLREALAARSWADALVDAVEAAQGWAGRPVRVEFVVERGRLWVLRVADGGLRGAALLRAVGALGQSGQLTPRQSLDAVADADLAEAMASGGAVAGLPVAVVGVGVSPGVASGAAVFSAAAAVKAGERGRPAVLVLPETRPADLEGMLAAAAVVTERGGRTSHAGVVARSLGRPCVTALRGAAVDAAGRRLLLPGAAAGRRPGPDGAHAGGQAEADGSGPVVVEGDLLTVDGAAGLVCRGVVGPGAASAPGRAEEAADWLSRCAAGQAGVEVWVSAERSADAARGLRAGAAGLGLCRTEHVFLGARQPVLERALLASRGAEAAEAARDLKEVLRPALATLLRVMDGRPVVVRLLDPPSHEFVPDVAELAARAAAAEASGQPPSGLERLRAARRVREHNPMLGRRGARLALLRPELTVAQVEALCEATVAARRAGGDPRPALLVPMVSAPAEVAACRAVLDDLGAGRGSVGPLPVGAMVETPRAALCAGVLAREADFLAVGTNDLTAMVWGLSRDDADREVLPAYESRGIVDASPFERLDAEGVGSLLARAVADARAAKPGIRIGACGTHAAEPDGVRRLAALGIDYVSCAASSVPLALLAAARVAGTSRNDALGSAHRQGPGGADTVAPGVAAPGWAADAPGGPRGS